MEMIFNTSLPNFIKTIHLCNLRKKEVHIYRCHLKFVDCRPIMVQKNEHTFLQQLNTVLKTQVLACAILRAEGKVISKSSCHVIVLEMYTNHVNLKKKNIITRKWD